ncbi:expressed unknown protein [Seminavis robusta]|uniref:NAD(P)-binding domain-containing protein n=1 Tax=Seminavis robusta TaxID=568900 RepID=A0A9N8D4E1_9STRA|nr:expressed unknown protein [Seminavis robusta]|eukprot:Sro2_g001230.1 n/a (206) ;mRNA; r:65013-65630
MARHWQGERALQAATANSNINYVILRAGKLVPDHEFPSDAPTGLTYGQGDAFWFFGVAGIPGMCNTQLARSVRTAMKVQGQYTVEVTGGTTDANDPKAFLALQQDQPLQEAIPGLADHSEEQVLSIALQCHEQALVDFAIYAGGFGLLFVLLMLRVQWGIPARIIALLFMPILFVLFWTFVMSDKSVEDCLRTAAAAAQTKTNEL